MRFDNLFIGVCMIVFGGAANLPLPSGAQSTKATEPTSLTLAKNEGERREFRTRPGTFFTLKVDPKNGGSEHMIVIAEDMAPGDRIPQLYFMQLLMNLPSWPVNDIDAWLPDRGKQAHAARCEALEIPPLDS
jgi:hypothetical protein